MTAEACLVNPPNHCANTLPEVKLGLGYPASVLRKVGTSAEIVDIDLLDLSLEEGIDRICSVQPLLVRVSPSDNQEPATFKSLERILRGVRKGLPSAYIVAGGSRKYCYVTVSQAPNGL